MSTPETPIRQQKTSEDVIFYRAEDEIGSSLPFKVYRWDRAGGSTRDHKHDYIQLWYVVKGEMIHKINGQSYRMMKGNLFVAPPHTVHRVDMMPGQDIDIIGCEFLPQFVDEQYETRSSEHQSVDAGYLAPFLNEEGEHTSTKIALSGETELEVLKLLEEMLGQFQLGKRHYELFLKANLLKVMAILIQEKQKQSGQTNEEDERLEKFRDLMMSAIAFINEHYHEELRLERLCRKFSISKTYFCALFKRFTGQTYNDYLINLRVHKAAALLMGTDMSITDICFAVGFNDVPYFSRVFKRQTGVTPSHFKKNATSVS
ncbi:AraC family transcriptional regulator [Paenibacillus sp. 1001270B_150601_E10]|uniref:AraC family transcriptional regulator n=1 Tax=Paenibacillus sp. 1001270B_150601_E10 TaxID=2787079 RepID=UPI00189DEE4F|nr:AraC family transcriptional regulator [Paenibacillus sp. 1001270B_150601_E10]